MVPCILSRIKKYKKRGREEFVGNTFAMESSLGH